MDGIHDLGGMDGFGRVTGEKQEPVFHAPWEGRVFGMSLGVLAQGHFNTDEFRHAIERMGPAHYLASGYYEHWLDALARLLRERGIVTEEELRKRARSLRGRGSRRAPPAAANPGLASALRAGVEVGASSRRDGGAAAFDPGDQVVVKRMHPGGHTRCPRYVRGARGVVERDHGRFVLPDASAHGDREKAEHVYCVGFEAAALWGQGDAGERIFVDLWESYLEKAR